jgi:hypothetical protein
MKHVSLRLAAMMAALALVACGGSSKKCSSSADCTTSGQTCQAGVCTTTDSGVGGGIGGGGGGTTGGGTGGGSTGGGTGGGSTGGGGGSTDAGIRQGCDENPSMINAGSATYSSVGYANTVNMDCTGSANPGASRVFQVTVPAGQLLQVTATPATAGANQPQYDLSLQLVAAPASNCDVSTNSVCLGASDNASDPTAAETASWSNSGTTDATVFIVIGSYVDASTSDMSTTYQGSFTLDVGVHAPLPGDSCQTATTLTAGTPLTNETTVGFISNYQNDSAAVGCVTGTFGADHAYSLVAPAGKRTVVTVTPSGTYDPSINLIAGPDAGTCDLTPRQCLGGTAPTGETTPSARSTVYYNQGTTDLSLFAIVDCFSGSTGNYAISVTSAAPLADEMCTTASTSIDSATTGSLANFGVDYATGTGCIGDQAADRVYTVSIPANSHFSTTITPTGATDGGIEPVLNLVLQTAAQCDSSAHACAAASAQGGGDSHVETLAYNNTTNAAVTGFITVGAYNAAPASTDFSVTTVKGSIATGDLCAMPETLAVSGAVAGSLKGFTHDVDLADQSCTPYYGPERYYTIDIPAGKTLSVTVNPAAGATHDATINVIDPAAATPCTGAATCLTFSDDPMYPTVVESITYANTGTATKTVIVVVSAYVSDFFDYSLNVTVQ